MKPSLLTLPALFVLTHSLLGADAAWNVNAAGNWADDANWNPASAPGATTGTTSPDSATFGTVISAARIVTVDEGRNVAGIDFAGNSSAYTLSGGSLVLSSGGTIQTSGAGSAHTDTISTPITLANADADTKGAYSIISGSSTAARPLVISGNIAGSATSGTTVLTLGGANTGGNRMTGVISDGSAGGTLAVVKAGAGGWTLEGANTFSGGLTVKAGTLTLTQPGSANAPGAGPITLGDTSGSDTARLVISNSFTVSRDLTVVSGSTGVKTLTTGNVGGPGYSGAITLDDKLTVLLSNTGTANTNFTLSGTAQLNLNANTLTLSLAHGTTGNTNTAAVTISKPIVGTGNLIVAGSGISTGTRTVTLSGTNTYTGGTTVGGTGTSKNLIVNVSGDQSGATGGWNIDVNNEATTATSTVSFNSGSAVSVATGKTITLGGTSGHFGARTLNANGTLTNDGSLLVRRSSTVNVGGSWTQNGTATVATQGGGQAALTINTGGSFTYASATPFALNTSTSENTVTNLTVNGGAFTTGTAIRNNTGALTPGNTAYSQVVLTDGGTLRLSASVAQLLTNNVGNIRMLVGETGAGGVIDTNGFDTAIDKPVINVAGQAGKLTKLGTGTLTLSGANSYTGATQVNGGKLETTTPTQLSDEAALVLATGATLALNHTGTDTVGMFTIDGEAQATGKWGRVGSVAALGADHESALITGDGLIDNTNNAAPFYWDGTGTGWAATGAWSISPLATTPDPVATPVSTSTVYFGTDDLADDQTVLLNGDQSAKSLTFRSPVVFTLTGGDADHELALGGLTIESGALGPVIGSDTSGQAVDLLLSASQTWNNLAAGTYLTTRNGLSLGGFTLTLAGPGQFDLAGPLSGTGSILKRGTGTLLLGGANTHTGSTTLDEGAISAAGNQNAATGSWLLRGYGPSGTTFNTVATTATWEAGSTRTLATGNTIQLGNTAAVGGTALQTLNCAGTVTANGSTYVGRGGRLNLTTGADWTQNGALSVITQGGGSAALTIAAGAKLTYAGTNPIQLDAATGSNSVLTDLSVDGGSLATGKAVHNSVTTVNPGTSSRITLSNGGTLKLTASVADIFTTAGATRTFVLGAGGGTIDTQAFSTTLTVPVTGTGSLEKAGTGVLTTTGTNTYTGETIISAGTLEVAGANFADEAAVTVAAGATLTLNFTGVPDVVGSLTLGGTVLGPGTYDAATHPGLLAGTGSLKIVAPDPFIAWIEGFGLAPADQDRTDDPDGDGMANVIEYLTGGNPADASDRGRVWVGTAGNKLVLSLAIRGEGTTFAGSPSPEATVDGATARIQGSTDLGAFTAPVSETSFVLPAGWPATAPTGFSYHTFQLDASAGLPNRGFLRVRAE
ncbi:MAG: autotransporter-associated beta strand repeat-containing protein [Verrucomicrobia bacterium]|nr:autotransporter-associated beta strand repeat-containing protein [Verrucomicrobiota bacterium]